MELVINEGLNSMSGASRPRFPTNLGAPDFDLLLRRLNPDRQQAIQDYENLRKRLVKFFEWNQCWSSSDDLANLSLDTLARKPDDLVMQDVNNYAYGVARNVLSEFKRRIKHEIPVDNLEDGSGSVGSSGDETDLDNVLDHQKYAAWLDACLGKLKKEDRRLVLDYYASDEETDIGHRQNLAMKVGMAANALRVRVHRLRSVLEKCFRKRLDPATKKTL
jgi:DNA-directed RNA polymerase specialized sigma24 family protein